MQRGDVVVGLTGFHMPEGNQTVSRPKGSRILVSAGCFIFTAAIIGGIAAVYFVRQPKDLRAPLVVALPNCNAGIYKAPSTAAPDLVDDFGNDVLRRACEGARDLQGVAILARDTLTLQIHNSDSTPLTSVRIRLLLKPKYATSFQREYVLQGKLAPLNDGELRTSTNLDPASLTSFSAVLTSLSFDVTVAPDVTVPSLGTDYRSIIHVTNGRVDQHEWLRLDRAKRDLLDMRLAKAAAADDPVAKDAQLDIFVWKEQSIDLLRKQAVH